MVTTHMLHGTAVTPHTGVSLHFLGEEGVLFDARQQKLYATNTAATFVWCCLEENLPQGEICERLSRTFKFRPADASAYVNQIVARWRDVGLVDGTTTAAQADTEEPILLRAPLPVSLPGGDGLERRPEDRDYRILDLPFRLRMSPAVTLTYPDPLLESFAVDAPPKANTLLLDTNPRGCGYTVRANGLDVERCESLSEVVPMIRASLLQLALRCSTDFAAVHAAAVADEGRCILLPGAAGIGKSTLAAALVSTGFQFLGDDTVVLTGTRLDVRPVPFAICVKEGAWSLLTERFPALMRQRVHRRPDGHRVRYLPAPIGADPTALKAVSAIVFPHREPGCASALIPISPPQALRQLLEGFYPLGDGLDITKVERLLRWIAAIDCFDLRFSSLDDGVAQIQSLCT